MNNPDTARPYLHLLPIERGELPGSWLHRIADRSESGFRAFSKRFLDDKVRNSAGFDAYPTVTLLKKLGAVAPGSETEIVRDHTLLGTTQCFYERANWVKYLASMEESEMRGQKGSKSYGVEHWHICPKCRESESATGIPTFQRNPQIPGIRYCWLHGVPLALVTNTKTRSSAPPLDKDLDRSVTKPVLSSNREPQHIQLAKDLSEAFNAGLPHLGPQGLNAAIFQMLGNVGLLKPRTQTNLPWAKMLQQIRATFGEDIFIETELLFALRRVKQGLFFKRPTPDSMVLLALLTRSFGKPLAEFFKDGVQHQAAL